MDFAIWKACKRIGVTPPGLKSNKWDELDVWSQAKILAFDQISDFDEMEEKINFAKATMPQL